jgi:ribonuclease HI
MIVKTISFITDPTVAEVMVVWQAIQFCWELGFQRAIFEGDSLIVISALRQVFTCWQGFEQLLDDTRLSLIVFFLKMCGIFEETPTKRLIEWPR